MKRIAQLVSETQEGWFEINLNDAPCATTVTPSGDVLLNEGTGGDRLNHWAISSENVVRFDLGRDGDDYEILVKFRRGSKVETLGLGLTPLRHVALAWVWSVNRIYKRRDATSKARIEEFRLGRFATLPAVYDILKWREDIYSPGDYLFSAEENPVPHELPRWQSFYMQRSIARLKEFARFNEDIRIVPREVVPHDYSWLSNYVRYTKHFIDDRITQPLELIFDRERRHRDVGIIRLDAHVTNFALVYFKQRFAAEALKLKPQESVAPTFFAWLEAVRAGSSAGKRIVVCTPTNQSVYYSVMAAAAKGLIPARQYDDRQTIGSLAEWLDKYDDAGVIACDIGVAWQIIFYMRRERIRGAEHVDFALVPYEKIVPVGLAYRVDDPKWGELCSAGLYDTLTSRDDHVLESWADTRIRARKVGIEIALAA